MATKKDKPALRGSKLIKKAVEAGKTSGVLSEPDPIPSGLVRKMKLPNGESLSPGLKELLATDNGWLGIDYDEDEAEVEATSLEDIVEEHFGEEAVAAFGEAYELLGDDFVAFAAELDRPAALYVGSPDDAGEYPVVSLAFDAGVARVGGFVPFDVWVAQQLGGLERGKDIGDVPPEYAELPKTLADANGDGRIVFSPKAGEQSADDDDEDDDDEPEGAA